MELNILSVPSSWGIELKQKHFKLHEQNNRLVVLFPGMHYSCELPILYYARATATQCGFDLLALEYGYQAARSNLEFNELPRVVDECEETLKLVLNQYEQIVFISKSLGTLVAGEVHSRLKKYIKHVYLTPIFKSIPYINATEGIIIYGSNDSVFDENVASQITVTKNRTIIKIADADHSLETKNVEHDILTLGKLVKLYKDFLNEEGPNADQNN